MIPTEDSGAAALLVFLAAAARARVIAAHFVGYHLGDFLRMVMRKVKGLESFAFKSPVESLGDCIFLRPAEPAGLGFNFGEQALDGFPGGLAGEGQSIRKESVFAKVRHRRRAGRVPAPETRCQTRQSPVKHAA